jgi:mannitol-1-/sugar-/sorbitol-6-phosphatase
MLPTAAERRSIAYPVRSRHGNYIRVLTRALLFDLDGVLVDSSAAVEQHWREFAQRYELDAGQVLRDVHGHRSADVITRLIAVERREEALEWFAGLELNSTIPCPAIAGAARLLAQLPPDRWAIVSSGTSSLIQRRLSCAGLPSPSVVVSAESVSRGKPDPEGYCLGAHRLGWSAAETTVIEDAPAGISAGSRSGALVIALTTTHSAPIVRSASVVVSDLSDIAVRLSGQYLVVSARIQRSAGLRLPARSARRSRRASPPAPPCADLEVMHRDTPPGACTTSRSAPPPSNSVIDRTGTRTRAARRCSSRWSWMHS